MYGGHSLLIRSQMKSGSRVRSSSQQLQSSCVFISQRFILVFSWLSSSSSLKGAQFYHGVQLLVIFSSLIFSSRNYLSDVERAFRMCTVRQTIFATTFTRIITSLLSSRFNNTLKPLPRVITTSNRFFLFIF